MSANKLELTTLTSDQFVKRLPADVWSLVLRYLTLAEIARFRSASLSFYNHKAFIAAQNQALRPPQIHATEVRSYFIDALGRMFVSGGPEFQPRSRPVKIAGLEDKRVAQVIEVGLNTVVLTRDGEVYEDVRLHGLRKITGFNNKKVVQMAPLLAELLFLTNEGDIYSIRSRNLVNPQLIFSSPNNKILQIVTGAALFAYCLTENGDVYSMGKNYYGQLGHGDTEERTIPEKILALQGKNIIQIVTGHMGFYFRSKDGKVYSLGKNDAGVLALGDKNPRTVPEQVMALADKNVVNIAAGGGHVIFATQEGNFYGAGDNSSGQLGLGDDLSDRSTPELITALQGKTIVKVVAGDFQTFFLTDKGEIYQAGKYFDNGFVLFARGQPEKITLFDEKQIVDVSPGEHHTIFLTNAGQFFTRGLNQRGQLALGDYENRDSPTRILDFQFKSITPAHSLPSISIRSLREILKTYHQNKGFFRKYFSIFIPAQTKTITDLEALTVGNSESTVVSEGTIQTVLRDRDARTKKTHFRRTSIPSSLSFFKKYQGLTSSKLSATDQTILELAAHFRQERESITAPEHLVASPG